MKYFLILLSFNLFAKSLLFVTNPNGIKVYSQDKTSELIFKYKDKLELNENNHFTKEEIEYEIPNSGVEKFLFSKEYFYTYETVKIFEKPFLDEKSIKLKPKKIYQIQFQSDSWFAFEFENKIYFISKNQNSVISDLSENNLKENLKINFTKIENSFVKTDKKVQLFQYKTGRVYKTKKILKKGFYDVFYHLKYKNKIYYSLTTEKINDKDYSENITNLYLVERSKLFTYTEYSEYTLKNSKHKDKKLLKQILYKGIQSGIDFSKLSYKIYPHKDLKIIHMEFENPTITFNRSSKYDGGYYQIQALVFIKNGKIVDSHISGDTKFEKLDLPQTEYPVFVFKEPFRGGMAYDFTFLFFTKKGILQHNFFLSSSKYDEEEEKTNEFYKIQKNKLDLFEVKNKKKKLIATYLVKNNTLYKQIKGKFQKIPIKFTPRLGAKYTRHTLNGDVWYE